MLYYLKTHYTQQTLRKFEQMAQHFFDIKVFAEDTDYGGIVYHANYLKYMERARTEWLNSIGISLQLMVSQNVLFVVRQANLQFHKSALLNDIVTIQSTVSLIKNTRLFFKQQVVKKDMPSIIYCTGDVEVVCIKHNDKKPIRLPNEIINCLNSESNG